MRSGIGLRVIGRRITPAQQDRIAHLQPVCLIIIDDEVGKG